MRTSFTSQIGYLAEKEGAEHILQGIIPEGLEIDEEAKTFLFLLAMKDQRKKKK